MHYSSWCLTHSTCLTSEKRTKWAARCTKVPSAGLKLSHSVQSWVLGAAFAMWSSITKTGTLFGTLSYPLLSWYPFAQLVTGGRKMPLAQSVVEMHFPGACHWRLLYIEMICLHLWKHHSEWAYLPTLAISSQFTTSSPCSQSLLPWSKIQ